MSSDWEETGKSLYGMELIHSAKRTLAPNTKFNIPVTFCGVPILYLGSGIVCYDWDILLYVNVGMLP